MNISNQIKGLLVEKSLKQQDLQTVLAVSSKQAVNNKFAKNSWSVEDLIKVVSFLDGELIIRVDEREIKLTEKYINRVDKEIKPITKSQSAPIVDKSAPIVAPKLDLDKLLEDEPKPKSGRIKSTE